MAPLLSLNASRQHASLFAHLGFRLIVLIVARYTASSAGALDRSLPPRRRRAVRSNVHMI